MKEGLRLAILPQAVLSAHIIFSGALSPQLVVRHFDSGSIFSAAIDNAHFVSGIANLNLAADLGGQVGDSVSVPPVVQSFIDAYKGGKIKEALAVIFDPLLKLINDIPANTDKEKSDKDRVLDALMAMRGMSRTQMSGPKGESDPPREIRVMRSFKADKGKVRIHLMIQHAKYEYYMRLITQETPVGLIITNIGFGEQDIFNE